MPEAVTPEEKRLLDIFLNDLAEVISWGGRGWDRADLARREACR